MPQQILRDTVNERVVRILLKCILVINYILIVKLTNYSQFIFYHASTVETFHFIIINFFLQIISGGLATIFSDLTFTARKRSLGQGNIFAPVCHSVHREGVPGPGEGLSAPGGCLARGGAWWRPPRGLLLRAVRILLECILVLKAVRQYQTHY